MTSKQLQCTRECDVFSSLFLLAPSSASSARVHVFVPGLGRDAKWPAKLLLAPGAIYSLRLCKDSEGSSATKRVLASQLVRESASITCFRNRAVFCDKNIHVFNVHVCRRARVYHWRKNFDTRKLLIPPCIRSIDRQDYVSQFNIQQWLEICFSLLYVVPENAEL